MKKIQFLIFSVLILMLSSCSKETLDSQSIFDTTSPERNAFDTWILKNYTTPYNIDFKYRYDDKQSDNTYNLAPADYSKSVALAKLVKYLWIDSYEELMGKDFIRKYCPKMIQLIGSPAYNTQGSIILGTAEGGLKITLYNVNAIDLTSLDVNVLNKWYFKTMHHEFAHILHQTKNYSTDFNLISKDYQSSSWVNLAETDALKMGFISNYASSEPQEDFVELISIYVTHDSSYWNSLLTQAGSAGSAGKAIILQKFSIVKDYLSTSWGIDIDKLRDIVQRRSGEIGTLDLTTLN
ncbi:MAG: putative zinc-binding metallopeptidase [Bacteroidota bacterium]|nr:putative zinc-binding metallopeptidase [Bacteroidota bacterium]